MKEYTVCFLFGHDLENVALVEKNRTEFKGLLNGIGGELEPGETAMQCALREIAEESGLPAFALRTFGDAENRLLPLGTLVLPHDCKYGTDQGCTLHYFAGVLRERAWGTVTPAGEKLCLRPVSEAVASGVFSDQYAGNGDLAYFVNAGLKAVRDAMGIEPGLMPYTHSGIMRMLPVHRDRLIHQLREGNCGRPRMRRQSSPCWPTRPGTRAMTQIKGSQKGYHMNDTRTKTNTGTPARRPAGRQTPKPVTTWGAYIPDIVRSYPDPPVRGNIMPGKYGKEFRPDRNAPKPKHQLDYALKNWITGPSYDTVVERMREEAYTAIQDKRAEIARLERFIDNN